MFSKLHNQSPPLTVDRLKEGQIDGGRRDRLTEGQIDGEAKGLRQGGREGKKRVERKGRY